MNMVSPPISQNPKWYIWRRANFPGPPAKPWSLGLLLTKSQSQPGLTKCEAGLSPFNMRFSWLNTTWNSATVKWQPGWEGEFEGEWIYVCVYIWLSPFDVHLKL